MALWYYRPVLFVADVERVVRFYVDKLGFSEKWRFEQEVAQVDRDECEIIVSGQRPAKIGHGMLFIELTAADFAALPAMLANNGVAEAGKEIATRPFQLVTGRVWRGTAFGGARGRTDVPKIVDWYMDGKIEIDPMITHTMPLERINDAFDLMHRGESIRSVVVY